MMDSHKEMMERYGWFWDRLESYLKTLDLKQTKQRKVIVEAFLKMNSHVDAETLYDELRKAHPTIGLATIYRTLNLLKAAGLIEERSFADGRSLYEIDHPGTHHDHLVCIECGRVIEFENQTIEALQRQIADAHGFTLTSHRLDLYGTCAAPACANAAKTKSTMDSARGLTR